MKRVTFLILCLEGAVLSFNVAAVAAMVPSIAADFALSQFFVGKIIWLYMLPYGLAALIYGPLVRAVDAKQIELACMFFFSLANLTASLAKNIYLLFACRFFMGLFGASVVPLSLILIARHIENYCRGRFVGIFFSATFIASLLGLFLSGIIPWRWIFLIPALCGFLLCLAMFFYLPSFQDDLGGFKISYFSAFRNRVVISIFIFIFFISLLYHGIQQWLGVYFSKELQFSQFVISMLLTLTSLSGIFGEAWGGRLADIKGRLKTANIGIMLMIFSIFLLIFKFPLVFLFLIMIAWGLGWTFNHVGVSTMLTDLPREFLNESASLNSGVRFLAGGIGVALGEILMQRNFNFGFLTFGAGLILLLIFAKKLLPVK